MAQLEFKIPETVVILGLIDLMPNSREFGFSHSPFLSDSTDSRSHGFAKLEKTISPYFLN